MYQVRLKSTASLSLLATSLLLTACAGGGDGGVPGAPPPAVAIPANVVIARGIGDGASFVLGGDIYLAKEDGTGVVVALANSTDYEEFKGATPGGRVIYLRSGGGQSGLYSVNADGTGMLVLANSSDDEYFSGTAGLNPITPGGRVIYERYIGGNNYAVYSVNTDGTGTVGLANSVDREEFNGFF